jgi:hypothetical protein
VRPEFGGRIDLQLESEDGEQVVYQAELMTPDGEWTGRARVEASAGAIELDLDGEPPPWLLGLARAVLRTIWRGGAGWPRRITRWRPEPDMG